MADHAAPPWDDEWLIPSDDEVEPELALFWSVEKSARILNGAMTPFEKWDLERWLEDGIPNAYQADITKAIRNYGKNRGAGVFMLSSYISDASRMYPHKMLSQT